jgi:4-amino-4-deoxy-L-arabinose transferase-like glycosyltransferase
MSNDLHPEYKTHRPADRPGSLPRWAWPVLAGALALIAYLLSRSASLDDFDSYSFALALRQFDLALQQPQPPGFPVYVALGRLFNLAFPDPRVALTTLSAVCGAASVAIVVWLGQTILRRDAAAILAGLIFAAFPVQWLTAAKALSDAPGLAFALGALALLWAGRRDDRLFVAGAALLGLSLGVRPQSNLPAILVAGWLAWERVRAGRWQSAALAGGAGLIAVLIWLIPTAAAAGGPAAYRALLAAHSQHVWGSDSLFAGGQVTGLALLTRFKDLLDTLLIPTLGVSVYQPIDAPGAAQLTLVLGFLAGGLALADWRRPSTWLLAGWALAVLALLYALESLYRPRLALPGIPPLALLAASGWARAGERPGVRRAAAWAVAVSTLVVFAANGASLARILTTEPAPPAQAAAAIREGWPPDTTLVAAAGSFRAAQVELPGYSLLYRYEWNEEAAQAASGDPNVDAIAVLDRSAFDEVIDTLAGNGAYVPAFDQVYTRTRRVHFQHAEVRLQVLVSTDAIMTAQYTLPSNMLDFGAPGDAIYLTQGWYEPETIGGVTARWAGGSPVSTLLINPRLSGHYEATLRASAFPPDQTVEIWIGGELAARFDLTQGWSEHGFAFDVAEGGDMVRIELRHSRTQTPFDQTGGASDDRRELAAAYDWLKIHREE